MKPCGGGRGGGGEWSVSPPQGGARDGGLATVAGGAGRGGRATLVVAPHLSCLIHPQDGSEAVSAARRRPSTASLWVLEERLSVMSSLY